MLDKINLKFGGSNQIKLSFTPGTMNLVVGPNNSGKSLFIRELSQLVQDYPNQKSESITNSKVIESLIFKDYNEEEIHNLIRDYEDYEYGPSESQMTVNSIISKNSRTYNKRDFFNTFKQPNSHINRYTTFFLKPLVLSLIYLDRNGLISDQPIGSLHDQAANEFVKIFRNKGMRQHLQRILFETFKKYLVLDHTIQVGSLHLKYSESLPENEEIECSLGQKAIDFFSKTEPIHDFGDGVKVYTGLLLRIIATRPKILFGDELEAFLSPPLAFKLGKDINNELKDIGQAYISTHSAHFLMGCIQGGTDINIIRLTFTKKAVARLLPKESLLKLMRDPLLRSSKLIEALFYEHVIVTEGDSDRAFYQEVNERLNQFTPEDGISNCLFINAQGKDTIGKIVEMLRGLGIPTTAIYDIDLLKNDGRSWSSALAAAGVPESLRASWGELRKKIHSEFKKSEIDMKSHGAISKLEEGEQEACRNLFQNLREYGIFCVENGEVESWLSYLNVKSHKSGWLPKMFERMGSDPGSPEYIKPQDGDVWQFMKDIKTWLFNENRKGIPD